MVVVHFFDTPHKFEDRPIPDAKHLEYLSAFGDTPRIDERAIIELPVPVILQGHAWTHAVQVDGGKQRLLGSTPPYPYLRVYQSPYVYQHRADGSIEREPERLAIGNGNFIFFRGHTFILCTSFEGAWKWVQASIAFDDYFCREMAKILATKPRARIQFGPPEDEG